MSTSRRRFWTLLVSVLQTTFLPVLLVASLSASERGQKFVESYTSLTNSSNAENISDNQQDFLQRLLQEVLGIEHAGHGSKRVRHNAYPPPQYMLDLYKTVANAGGLTLTPNPYYANVVRSFLDRDSNHNLRFFFNLSSSMRSKRDSILEAEFHLYKLKPRLRAKAKIQQLKSQLLEVKVYQVMYKGKSSKKRKLNNHKLLDTRRVSVASSGWEVFYVKEAVTSWVQDNSTNMGLLLTVRTLDGEVIPDGVVRFAKRHHHLVNRHPLLVLFVDDGRHSNKEYQHSKTQAGYHTYGYKDWTRRNDTSANSLSYGDAESNGNNGQYRQQQQASRPQRAVGHATKDDNQQSCMRHDLYVDFEKIGWAAWIISPKGYNAHYCKGHCAFPLGQNQWPTNHATVQSIVYELKLAQGVNLPCCVPNKLYPISLLYFDEHENVILKQYDDMVAFSCGCH